MLCKKDHVGIDENLSIWKGKIKQGIMHYC